MSTMPTAPPTMSPHEAVHVMATHLLLVDTHGPVDIERCSRCRTPWKCADRAAAEVLLYGRELDR